MSGGEKRRVALARILVAKPDLAIFDEPTNHLDADTIAWLEEYLRRRVPGRGAARHARSLPARHGRRRACSISKTAESPSTRSATTRVGAFEDFLEQKAERFAHAERVESNRQNFLRKEIEWLRRGPKARSTKQKARIQRAETAIAAEGCACAARSSSTASRRAPRVSAARSSSSSRVSLDLGGRRLIDDLTLRLVKGNRIGIVGPNGAGQDDAPAPRHRRARSRPKARSCAACNTKFAYFDQARTTLRDDWTVFDNVAEREGADRTGAGTRHHRRSSPRDARLPRALHVRGRRASAQGLRALRRRARARRARARAKTGANVLLLDEPTNDLDIATLGSLAELIESWPGCVLVVSHDRFFLDRVVTSILAFEGRRQGAALRRQLGELPRTEARGREGRQARKAGRVFTATSRLERTQSARPDAFPAPGGHGKRRGPGTGGAIENISSACSDCVELANQ